MKLHLHERLEGLHPREAFRRWRDEIVERAAGVPHVRDLTEHERAQEGERLRRRLRYALDVELPLVARAFLGEEALRFELAEAWDESCLGCDWSLRSLGIPAETAAAQGALRFGQDGLVVEGEVRIAPDALPALARSMAPAIEQTLARSIERGYRALARTLHR